VSKYYNFFDMNSVRVVSPDTSTQGVEMNGQAQFAAGWGTLSLINAGLAQAKGRSGLLWWLLSLLLGPVATFLIVVLPQVSRQE